MICRLCGRLPQLRWAVGRRGNHSIADAYRTLKCARGVSHEQLTEQYRRLVKQYHPDRPEGDAAKMKEITAAYRAVRKAMADMAFDEGLDAAPDGAVRADPSTAAARGARYAYSDFPGSARRRQDPSKVSGFGAEAPDAGPSTLGAGGGSDAYALQRRAVYWRRVWGTSYFDAVLYDRWVRDNFAGDAAEARLFLFPDGPPGAAPKAAAPARGRSQRRVSVAAQVDRVWQRSAKRLVGTFGPVAMVLTGLWAVLVMVLFRDGRQRGESVLWSGRVYTDQVWHWLSGTDVAAEELHKRSVTIGGLPSPALNTTTHVRTTAGTVQFRGVPDDRPQTKSWFHFTQYLRDVYSRPQPQRQPRPEP